MRKIFYIIPMIITLLLTSTSCSGKVQFREIAGSEESKAHFAECMHPDEVLADYEVDFKFKPDFEGLTKKTVTDEESGEQTEEWYNSRENKVYSVYTGYEDYRFDYYTETKSGKSVTVSYGFTEGDEADWVWTETDSYMVYYSEISDSRASEIYIEENLPGSDTESVSYRLKDNIWFTETAVYFGEEGLVRLYGVNNGEEDEFITEVIAEKAENVTVSDLSEMQYSVPLQFSAGDHSLSFTQDGNDRQWYLTAAFIFQFDDDESAKAFSEKYNLPEPGYDSLDGETPQIITDEYTLKISPEFAQSDEFAAFVTTEINDRYSLVLSLDDNGEITGFDNGYTQFY